MTVELFDALVDKVLRAVQTSYPELSSDIDIRADRVYTFKGPITAYTSYPAGGRSIRLQFDIELPQITTKYVKVAKTAGGRILFAELTFVPMDGNKEDFVVPAETELEEIAVLKGALHSERKFWLAGHPPNFAYPLE